MKIKIIFLFFCIFIFQSCEFFNQIESDIELTEKKYKTKNQPVNLKEITHFEWDTYTVLGPYTNVKNYAKNRNLDFSNIYLNAISRSDFFQLLVFIKDNKSIKICELYKFTPISENNKLE